ncbi:MAG: O-methyltransferase [Mycobacteriaceae bacterium]|uniref:O-methyltransferase n=1 Tax=Corynebacterium sp. TaxID=1720 RepID=UPI003F943BA7
MPRPPFSSNLITDPQVLAVLDELYERERMIEWETYQHHPDPRNHPGTGFSMSPEQADQLYLLVRHGRARNVVEFATSLGFSTTFLAAAVRDSGANGTVYSAELVPEKVEAARGNLSRAGLADYADIREGDARETLADVPDDIDFLLLDGWAPAVSLEVLQLVEPKLRSGALIYNENLDREFLDHVQAPGSGYRSLTLLSGSDYKPAGELVLRE